MLDFVFVTLRFITVKWGVLSRLIWSISPLTLHCLNDVSMCFFFFCFILVFYFSTITIGIFCFTHFTLSCIYTKSLFLYHISSCILLLLFLPVECKCFFFLVSRRIGIDYSTLSVVAQLENLFRITHIRSHARTMHTHDKENEKFCSFSGTNTNPSTNLAGAHSNSY